MQELRVLLDLDMMHKNYKEVYIYIENLSKTFPGLVRYSSIEAVRKPDKEKKSRVLFEEIAIRRGTLTHTLKSVVSATSAPHGVL